MQDSLGGLKAKWGETDKRRTGVMFGLPDTHGANLTNVRFTDGVVMVAQKQARHHPDGLSVCGCRKEKYGIKLHLGKTKIMTWDQLSAGCHSISLGDKKRRNTLAVSFVLETLAKCNFITDSLLEGRPSINTQGALCN